MNDEQHVVRRQPAHVSGGAYPLMHWMPLLWQPRHERKLYP
jgi:hypothetical protein